MVTPLPLSPVIGYPCTGSNPCIAPGGAGGNIIDPKDPDYVNISVSIGAGGGFTGNLIFDRFGDVYISLGGNIGKSLTPLSGSISAGWIGDPFDDYYPSPVETTNFLEELTINGSAGVLVGGGLTISPGSTMTGGIAYEGGAYWPQMGISASWTFKFIDKR